MSAPLPIDPALPEIVAALDHTGLCVLQAPPGAGKTTRVPLALLGARSRGRIVMLEPRRVAARAAADRLAAELREPLGQRVGLRMRGESVPGKAIEVVTEGVLTRLLHADPELSGISTLIFDEFHERSLQADLGLALALEVREALRPDLRLLVMSATLDAGPVAALMGGAPIVTAEGRSFPVDVRWADRPVGRLSPRDHAAETAFLAQTAAAETEAAVLVFLPGRGEIERTATTLADCAPGLPVLPLHGTLPAARQRAALTPAPGARVVLATAIAETSLTIPDVRAVVDGGLARRARFDPAKGMSRLVTDRVTRAEAEQRRGRAGRVAEGICLRLWSRGEEGALQAHAPPEIAAADLAPLALDLALWGTDGAHLPFLTPPPEAQLDEARRLLRDLGALDASGRITDRGRAMAAMPTHPRLAAMLSAGGGRAAAELAALLEARGPLPGEGVNLSPRLAALSGGQAAFAEARRTAKRLAKHAGKTDDLSPGARLSLAYPDRIGLRRSGDAPRWLLSGGAGASLDPGDGLAQARLLVAADLDGDRREARIRLALPVTEAEIKDLHGDRLDLVNVAAWSRRDRRVRARRRLRLGALVLEDRIWRDVPAVTQVAAMLDGVRDLGLAALPWEGAPARLRARIAWIEERGAEMPDVTDDGLLAALADWLAPALAGITTADALAQVDLVSALTGWLGWERQQTLDRLAPPEIRAPTGTRLPVDYATDPPSVAVRLQEMFGTTTHPTVGPDRLPLMVTLLSPAGRPVQTTSDLPRFWATSYADVRKDLRGRYPKHPWPEDPSVAPPTTRAKPRR